MVQPDSSASYVPSSYEAYRDVDKGVAPQRVAQVQIG